MEQDYVLSWVLYGMASIEELRNNLAFKGVTGETISLDGKRRLKLRTFVEDFFDGDSDRWLSYCLHMTEDHFLMKSNPNGPYELLDWVLKPVGDCGENLNSKNIYP